MTLVTYTFQIVRTDAQAADQYALSFDGNDYVNLSGLSDFGTNSITVEGWIKPSFFGDYDYIFTAGRTGDNPIVALALNSSSRLVGYIEGDTSGQVTTSNDGAIFAAGTWYHIAIVFDRTNNQAIRYINGVQTGTINSLSTLGSSTISTLGESYIARSNRNLSGEHFGGSMDELRVWHVARTQQEISDNMYLEIESAPGLVARWGFNEGTGSTINDSSGNDVTGTIYGATWIPGELSLSEIIVTTDTPSSVRGSTATLNGTLGLLGEDSSVDVYFKYGTDAENLDHTTTPITLEEPGSFDCNISDLSPGTAYFFKAFAEGSLDTAEGETRSFGKHALNFSNDTVNGGDLTAIEGSSALTVEAWVKGSDYTEAIPISKHTGASNGSFYLAYLSANTLRFTVITSSGRVDHDVGYTLDSEWHHFAGVYDGSTARIYFDGVQVGETSSQTGTIQANSQALLFGNYGGMDWPWSGDIDEVRIWNTARTAEDISQNMNSEIESASGLVARWGFNEGSGPTIEDTTGNGNDGTISGATWTTGYSFLPPNYPPNQPSLVTPQDDSTGASASPQLEVTVSDPEQTAMTVTYYGREHFEPEDDFTLVTLPDTQYYSASYPATFSAQTQWITDNIDSLNILTVLHEGDVVDSGSNSTQWSNAISSLSTLDTNNIPNLISIGNHDYDDLASTRASINFNSAIPYDTWYNNKGWFTGGSFETGKSENVYYKTSVGDLNYLFITLEFGPRQAVIDWANQIISDNPDHQVVIVTHTYMYSDDTRVGDGDSWNPHSYGIGSDAHDGDEMWTELVSQHENVFLVLSGHILNDGLGYLSSAGTYGNNVHQILANYQMLSDGGNGWLRYYVFNPQDDKVYAYTYSPTLDQFDTSSANQFTLDYNFTEEDDFIELGSYTDIESDTNSTHTWENLDFGTQYDWYVSVDDGELTTTSPIWSFTTDQVPSATLDDIFLTWETQDISVNYNLIDEDADLLNISQTDSSGIEFSSDGSNWYDASDAGGLSEGYTGLSSSPSPGEEHLFIWDSGNDLPNIEDNSVYLRIRPNDGTANAEAWVVSSGFGLDNRAPTDIGPPTLSAVSSSEILISKPTTVTESGSGLYQWQARRNGSVLLGFDSVSTTSVNDTSLAENTNYSYGTQFSDITGNISEFGTSDTVWTFANSPSNLTPDSVGSNSIRLSVDPLPNATSGSSGYFFSRSGANSGWITTNTWTDTNLACNTQYDYTVKYRNGDGVETETISLSQQTDDCNKSNPPEEEDEDPTPTTPPAPVVTPPPPTTLPSLTPEIDNSEGSGKEPSETELHYDTEEFDTFFFFTPEGDLPIYTQTDGSTAAITGMEIRFKIHTQKDAKRIDITIQQTEKSHRQGGAKSVVPKVYADDLIFGSYSFSSQSDNRTFQGILKVPEVTGQYLISGIINLTDNSTEYVEKSLTVNSEGYLYEEIGEKELRIPGAEVSLFVLNSNTQSFELWDASPYNQENPQITDKSGEYYFIPTSGKFYLTVSAEGYDDYKSSEFTLSDGQLVTQVIELTPEKDVGSIILKIFVGLAILSISGICLSLVVKHRVQKKEASKI